MIEINTATVFSEWLVQFVAFIVTGGVTVTVVFQWKSYKFQQKTYGILTQHNLRIDALERDVTVIKGEMVGWAVLKRIELYLSTISPDQQNSAILNAIRAEEQSRTRRYDD